MKEVYIVNTQRDTYVLSNIYGTICQRCLYSYLIATNQQNCRLIFHPNMCLHS